LPLQLQRLLLALPTFAKLRADEGHSNLLDQEFFSMAAFPSTGWGSTLLSLHPYHHM
jgi:hypothetical protein